MTVSSSQERFAANMPRARGFMLRGNPDYPRLGAWFDAMDARPAYQQVHGRQHTVLPAPLMRVQLQPAQHCSY
jgi:glutathione S-transferase